MYRVLVFAAAVAFCAAVQKCPLNEEFQECGTACPRTCANRNDGPKPCILLCKQGCFCKKDFMRNSKGVCVREENCDGRTNVPLRPTCGRNEEYVTCGTACPKTCENRNDNRPRPCPAMCVIGCQCQKGFLKNKDGKCVREQECDGAPASRPTKQCEANEVFQQCASTCPTTCANRNQGPIPCNRMCKMNSCECKKGFVRNASGKCVRGGQCGNTCTGKNEVLTSCGARCQPKCNANGPQICPMICAPGCTCMEGYARDSKGQCVKKEECPAEDAPKPTKQCGPNEEFQGCASTCPKTCANRNEGPRPCNKMCKLNSCECKKGFVRNGSGKCVRENQCEDSCTGKNEVLTPCMARCQPKCNANGPQICPAICAPGCTCAKGYARDSKGQCVKKEECPEERKERSTPQMQCTGKNEEYTACNGRCDSVCGDFISPGCFQKICVPGCVCKKGFARNKIHVCMEKEQCPNINAKRSEAGPNEVFSPCAAHCTPTCTNKMPICNRMCVPGYTCAKGYFRNDEGRCVTEDEC